jgi:acid phosphatase type 7
MAGVVVLLVGVVAGLLVADGDTAPTTTAAPITTTTTTQATTTTSTTLAPIATTTLPPEPSVEQITVIASGDTVVDNQSPDTNFGSEPTLEIEQEEADIRRALIGFDVTEIPEGRTVAGVTLQIFQIDASEEGALVSFVDGEWSETETTWSSAPPVGAPITPLAGGAGAAVVEVDVTSAVTGNGRASFYLTTESDDGLDFESREGGQSPPTLVITLADPETGVAGRGTVLVGAGDIASCESDGDEITAALLDEVVAEANEAVVFTAGDNAYEAGSAANFADCYEPSWGRHRAITRPAVGSREYRTSGASAYFEYFGEAAGDPALGYYSYNLGGWHILVVNSNCPEIGGCEAGSPQEQWVREDLAAHSTACTLAYWHTPLFSSRSGGTNPEMLPIVSALDEAEVDVIVNGNDHFYERFLPQDPEGGEDDDGIVQFTIGTGGRSLDDFLGPSPNSATRYNESFGVLALSLFAGGYDFEFVAPAGITFSDSGIGACH